ncbi:MAG: cyclomaltodextrinase N-terminal domain-containing protein [Acidobacteria bacterium]|nr:cyclomaltodextrinase N-terminal domain-containing protein [Acidobacteriota bacterium]
MKLRLPQHVFKTLATLLVLLACSATHAGAQPSTPEVFKVEPPSWWAGHSINPVRLLVRGRNLHGARVMATRAETEAFGATVNAAGTYLFVNVRINPAAHPGAYPLTVETPAGKAVLPFSLNAPLDLRKNFQGITTDDVIYLIMPDRFSDGDPKNNAPAGSPAGANDRRNTRAYHGGDLRGVINHLPYMKDLGVTAIWLTPWYDNWNGISQCDKPWCPNTSYHGYGAIDYYGVEDHFGDLATLRELVERAHAAGIKIIQDQVANHVNSHHPWLADPPLDSWFHGTRARHVQNQFRADLLLSPHASPLARAPTLDGWFADDLPDMNQDEPEVARYEIQNSLWWVGVTGLDGIRQDTIQYMPRPFIRDLSDALRREYPRIWMVGEVFDRDPVHTSYFIGGHAGWDGVDTHLPSVFDFPSWQVSLDVFTNKRPVKDLRYILRSDALYPDPSRLVMMANNHDTRRFMSLEGATVEGAMLHLAYVLTTRGTPQLYYGEELAMEGGEDPDNRRDFPGGFPKDARDAFNTRGREPREQRMYEWTRDLIRLRREHSAIRGGELIDLAFDDDSYAYARLDERETVVIAINRAAVQKEIKIDASMLNARDGVSLAPLLTATDRPAAVSGTITLRVPARSAAAYKMGDR